MTASFSRFKAKTVLGLVEQSQLGIIMPHEHILCDSRRQFFSEPDKDEEKVLAISPVTLDNLWWVRANALNNLDCLEMPGEAILEKELIAFRRAGGSTLVDVSTPPMGGYNPLGLRRLSSITGLNIIMGSGYYSGLSFSKQKAALSTDELCHGIINDLTVGIEGTDVCAGIIGEIGLTPAFQEDERRILCACAIAQSQTGAPLSIHPPGLDRELLSRIFQLLVENGGLPHKTVICHVDIMGLNLDIIRWIAQAGYYVEFDTFGHLFPPFRIKNNVMVFPCEGQRIYAIQQLIREGYLEHILISQDTFLKIMLTTYGGFGYGYILNNIVPAMLRMGITQTQIQAILVDNPGKFLSYIQSQHG